MSGLDIRGETSPLRNLRKSVEVEEFTPRGVGALSGMGGLGNYSSILGGGQSGGDSRGYDNSGGHDNNGGYDNGVYEGSGIIDGGGNNSIMNSNRNNSDNGIPGGNPYGGHQQLLQQGHTPLPYQHQHQHHLHQQHLHSQHHAHHAYQVHHAHHYYQPKDEYIVDHQTTKQVGSGGYGGGFSTPQDFGNGYGSGYVARDGGQQYTQEQYAGGTVYAKGGTTTTTTRILGEDEKKNLKSWNGGRNQHLSSSASNPWGNGGW